MRRRSRRDSARPPLSAQKGVRFSRAGGVRLHGGVVEGCAHRCTRVRSRHRSRTTRAERRPARSRRPAPRRRDSLRSSGSIGAPDLEDVPMRIEGHHTGSTVTHAHEVSPHVRLIEVLPTMTYVPGAVDAVPRERPHIQNSIPFGDWTYAPTRRGGSRPPTRNRPQRRRRHRDRVRAAPAPLSASERSGSPRAQGQTVRSRAELTWPRQAIALDEPRPVR